MIDSEQITGEKLQTLPPEAGDINAPRFEPDDGWLKSAPAAEQKAAVWHWFATHYESPVSARPHSGDGAFLYEEGEPFHVEQLLTTRFSLVVPTELLNQLVERIRAEAGDEWVWKDLDKLSS